MTGGSVMTEGRRTRDETQNLDPIAEPGDHPHRIPGKRLATIGMRAFAPVGSVAIVINHSTARPSATR